MLAAQKGQMQGNRSCDSADSCFWKKWYCWGVREIKFKGGFDVCNATINPIVDGRSKVIGRSECEVRFVRLRSSVRSVLAAWWWCRDGDRCHAVALLLVRGDCEERGHTNVRA